MPKPTKGPRLGGSPSHQRLILANLASQLFEHGRITTTETRAARLQPFAERLITKAKPNNVHARRQVAAVIRNRVVADHLFTNILPDMENREGGYTRITKIGPRKGDNAPMAVIELVRGEVKPKKAKADKAAAPAEAPVEVAEAPEEAVEAVEVEAVEADADAAAEAPVEAAADEAAADEADAK